MKKILVSLLLLSTAAFQADAASKSKAKHRSNTYIDHSYDEAYSARWAATAQSPSADADFRLGQGNAARSYVNRGTRYYGLNNYTVYGATAVSMTAPYDGREAPSWDGPVKNRYRNLRAYNESEPIPSNSGSTPGSGRRK
jgi:hypothetical protein